MFISFSLHVSGDYVPMIRRNNCIYAKLGKRRISYQVGLTRLYRDVGQQNLKFEIKMLSNLFDLRNGKEVGGNDVLMR